MDNSVSFLEHLATQIKDLVFVYDYQKRYFEFISPSVETSLGLTKDSINQSPDRLLQLVTEEDRPYLQQEMNRLKEAGTPSIDIEFRIYKPQAQELCWYRLKAFTLAPAAGETTHFAGIAEDITKRKVYEQGLLTIKEQKNITIQVLGHDLRAPLNTISLSMMLLGKEIDLEGNQKIRQLVDIVDRTCRNSLDMIKEVLTIEYTETQEMGIKKMRLDVLNRIQNQIDTFQLLDKSGKSFVFNKPAETLFASTDSVRLMLILENLLTNAYKFTDANGRIEVGVTDGDGTFTIQVKDNGIGIPEKLKPLIFDKFTKARRKGTQGEQPVGLGMHLIRTMTEQLEGKIWFDSEEGKGTTFYVELPK